MSYSWQRYLDELIDPVEVIVGTCSLLRNKAFLKGGESTVHIMLQTRLKNKKGHNVQDLPTFTHNRRATPNYNFITAVQKTYLTIYLLSVVRQWHSTVLTVL